MGRSPQRGGSNRSTTAGRALCSWGGNGPRLCPRGCRLLVRDSSRGLAETPAPDTEQPQRRSLLTCARKTPATSMFVTELAKDGGSGVENPPADAGDEGSIPGLGKSLGVGNGNLFQYSCLGNPMDRGAWRATAHGVAKSWTQLRYAHTCNVLPNKYLKK